MPDVNSTLVAMPLWGIYFTHIAPIVIVIFICFWVRYSLRKNNKYMIKIFDEQNKKLEKLKSDLASNSNSFADTIITAVKSSGNSLIMPPESAYASLYEVFHKVKNLTSNYLYETMVSTKACRVAIYLFHNGTKTPGGLSFVKISCIGEKVLIGSGIKERTLKHSGMNVNVFDDMYSSLIESGRCLLMSTDESVMSSSKAEFISAPKIQYSQAVSIYDGNNNVIGFILAEFDHVYNKTIADTEYDQIFALAKNLSPMLSYSDYVNLMTSKDKEDN